MSRPSPSVAHAAALLTVAALLAAGAADAQDPPPAAGGALRVTAQPPRLVLGRDQGTDLHVAAPPDVEELSVTASAGRVDAVRRLPGGGFAARYHAPSDHVPRVAFVSAVAHGARAIEDGWLAIPMSGEGDARVRGAPGTEVTLRIGDRTFGPRRAGEDGVAVIPIVVPPGVREGHQGFRPIDLRVPETPLLHAVADRAAVRADREEKVRVVAYVVAPHGAARRGDAPVFEPSRGTVSVVEREAGAYQASWTLPPGPAGDERLTIRLPAAPASRAVLRVEAAAGPPAVVAVSFDREAIDAGGEPASVTARALDAAGNPVPAALALEARGGDLTDVGARRPRSFAGTACARRCSASRSRIGMGTGSRRRRSSRRSGGASSPSPSARPGSSRCATSPRRSRGRSTSRSRRAPATPARPPRRSSRRPGPRSSSRGAPASRSISPAASPAPRPASRRRDPPISPSRSAAGRRWRGASTRARPAAATARRSRPCSRGCRRGATSRAGRPGRSRRPRARSSPQAARPRRRASRSRSGCGGPSAFHSSRRRSSPRARGPPARSRRSVSRRASRWAWRRTMATILIVDDEPVILDVFRRFLEADGRTLVLDDQDR